MGGFALTPADAQLIDKNNIFMQVFPTPGPVDGFPTDTGEGAGIIPFQFPPRITSDGKEMNWDEHHEIRQWEPWVMFNGATPRHLTLETHYVVTSKSKSSGGWTPHRVAEVLRTYRSYFYQTQGAVGPDNMPLIAFHMYEFVPKTAGPVFWKSKGVTMTPDGGYIKDGDSILPLITKVSINLDMVTAIINRHNFAELPPKPRKEWY